MSFKNSICGIECVFPDITDIWEFFKFEGIDFEGYYFAVVDEMLYSKGKGIDIPDEFYPEYLEELRRLSFVGERLVLHLYPNNCAQEKIDTYKDFLQSKCEMLVLMCDCYYVEIYCKNIEWLHILLRTARKISGINVIEKTPENDSRTEMYV